MTDLNTALGYIRMGFSETFGFPPPMQDPNEIAAKAFCLGIAGSLVLYGAMVGLGAVH